jgi:F-type H+-transporting ATPase subunit epsilon
VAEEQGYAVTLVTPERVLVEARATQVVLRTADGDATFLDGHTPLVGAIVPGAVRITGDEGTERTFAVHGGFVQVEKGVVDDGTRVTILSPVAEPADEIDVPRAQAALAGAEARVAELGGPAGGAPHGADGEAGVDPELVDAQAAVERARVRLEVAGVTEHA